MFSIVPERPHDAAAINSLLEAAFGPDRLQKTVYKLRDGVEPIAGLSFVAIDEGGIVQASIRFWPVAIGPARTPAILLGPLAVLPAKKGQGMGKALMRHSLAVATDLGHRICVLVGDRPYYEPFGFVSALPYGLQLPGWVDPNRFLLRELAPGAMAGVGGMIGKPAKGDSPRRRRARVA